MPGYVPQYFNLNCGFYDEVNENTEFFTNVQNYSISSYQLIPQSSEMTHSLPMESMDGGNVATLQHEYDDMNYPNQTNATEESFLSQFVNSGVTGVSVSEQSNGTFNTDPTCCQTLQSPSTDFYGCSSVSSYKKPSGFPNWILSDIANPKQSFEPPQQLSTEELGANCMGIFTSPSDLMSLGNEFNFNANENIESRGFVTAQPSDIKNISLKLLHTLNGTLQKQDFDTKHLALDHDLMTLPTPELNTILESLRPDIRYILKCRRRKLKNRGYARKSRAKKMHEQSRLQRNYLEMQRRIQALKIFEESCIRF